MGFDQAPKFEEPIDLQAFQEQIASLKAARVAGAERDMTELRDVEDVKSLTAEDALAWRKTFNKRLSPAEYFEYYNHVGESKNISRRAVRAVIANYVTVNWTDEERGEFVRLREEAKKKNG